LLPLLETILPHGRRGRRGAAPSPLHQPVIR
jgi:hypothetical protein